MLSPEDNEVIAHVGPGTPMGDLMREYWVPAMLSRELPEPDCVPLRVMLLGEKLVGFRDTEGRVGLFPHNCPHKKASLFFGRNEEGGIRCVFHGWKFAVDGTCLDMPNEPPGSTFKDKVRAKAYPCVERAGVVWTYMGARSEPPPLPALEVLDGSEEDVVATAYQVECNWLQASENDLDPSHFAFLHAGHGSYEDVPEGSAMRELLRDRSPRMKVLDTDAGVLMGAYREQTDGESTSWFVYHHLLPWYSINGVGVAIGGPNVHVGRVKKRAGALIKVPMDDTHTMAFVLSRGATTASADGSAQFLGGDIYRENPLAPNTSDWLGRFRWIANKRNDYLIDRDKQRRSENYTGLSNVIVEDALTTESMGDMVDRSEERLGAADAGQIRVRRRLLAAARAFAADPSVAPPGVDQPHAYRVRAGYVELPSRRSVLDAAETLRRGTSDPDMPAIAERPWSVSAG